MYTVNATNVVDIAKGIELAKRYNTRSVVKNTGHDLLVRCNAFPRLFWSIFAHFLLLVPFVADPMAMAAGIFGCSISGKALPFSRSTNQRKAARRLMGKAAHS